MKYIIAIALTLTLVSLSALAQDPLAEQVRHYETRYQLTSLGQKLVNNTGDGFDELYGVRNLRVVLRGVLYRGGANNAYNKYKKRDNQNPLPDMGLRNLCAEGFSGAVYLYDKNFSTAAQNTTCTGSAGNTNRLRYQQITAMQETNEKVFLKMIFETIRQGSGPLYMHCWNGWHASGLISALALRQFCGMAADEALAYWAANTDGNSQGFSKIKNRIRQFKALPEFQLTPEEQRLICLP